VHRAEAALKERERDDRDDEIMRLKMLWGERREQGTIVAGNNRRSLPCRSPMT
jgi:hypothetical protein